MSHKWLLKTNASDFSSFHACKISNCLSLLVPPGADRPPSPLGTPLHTHNVTVHCGPRANNINIVVKINRKPFQNRSWCEVMIVFKNQHIDNPPIDSDCEWHRTNVMSDILKKISIHHNFWTSKLIKNYWQSGKNVSFSPRALLALITGASRICPGGRGQNTMSPVDISARLSNAKFDSFKRLRNPK